MTLPHAKAVLTVASSEMITEILERFLNRQVGVRCVAAAHHPGEVATLSDAYQPDVAVILVQPSDDPSFAATVKETLRERNVDSVVIDPADGLDDVLQILGVDSPIY